MGMPEVANPLPQEKDAKKETRSQCGPPGVGKQDMPLRSGAQAIIEQVRAQLKHRPQVQHATLLGHAPVQQQLAELGDRRIRNGVIIPRAYSAVVLHRRSHNRTSTQESNRRTKLRTATINRSGDVPNVRALIPAEINTVSA